MSTADPDEKDTDTRPQTWLAPDQVERLRDACLSAEVPTYLQDRNEALVAFLYDTGLRRSEAAALNVRHLDLDRREVRVPSTIQKGDAPAATLDLGKYAADSTRALRRYLRDRWKDTDALFPSRQADRMNPRSISRAVTRAAQLGEVVPQAVDVPDGTDVTPDHVTAHTLRHSVAYRIIREEGGRLEDVQLRLRHASRRTTDEVYSHLRRR